ncbi:TPA: MobF family relaxase, partial [Klebsiella pneumoniae]
YYTEKDNYYVIGSMEERWQGKGAELLGLEGKVDKQVFTELLQGKLPDGSDLTRIQDGVNKHRPGYDLTFSAPKSVSMLAMLGGDKRLIDAHNRAVTVALNQVESLASTRVKKDGVSETVLTGNLIIARFNHDTSRAQDPQIHTHSVVINATQNGDKWQTLASDTVGKTGFSETILANRIAFGKIYQNSLRADVESMGYKTVDAGRNGMWEMEGVPVESFSTRSQELLEAAGPDASLKSRDVAALDTRKSKEAIDPAENMVEWMNTLKETGFDIRGYREAADARAAELARAPAAPVNTDGPDITDVVTKAIAGLSDRKVQFTYADLLARTVGQLEAKDGVFDLARKGIDAAIEREQLIPLDREKGLFTSNIHVLDELAVKALSQEVQRQNHVSVTPDASVVRQVPFSDAVSVLAQDRPVMGIVSGQGGATGQRERVTASSNMLTLKDRDGVRLDLKVSAVDSQWTLFRADTLPVAEGERLAVLGKIPDTRLKGGESITVMKVEEGQLTVQRPGQKTTQTLAVGAGVFDGIKIGHGWVESPGRSVSETAMVFASVTQRELDNATLNQLAQSGSHLRLYSAQDAARTTEKLSRHTAFSVVSEQLKTRSGETDLDAAIAQQKAGLRTPAEQAIHLAIPLLESEKLTFSRPQLLATALETGGGKVPMADIDTTIQAQIRSGQLLNVPVAHGYGNDLLISRQTWDAEKSILTHVLEGKDAVAPLMDRVPASLMTDLTAGQRAATRMILESTDRFTVVQGYAGVGKTTQ